MSQGCIITVNTEGVITDRRPFWPWPAPSAYPKVFPDGRTQYFFPIPYWNFTLRSVLREKTGK